MCSVIDTMKDAHEEHLGYRIDWGIKVQGPPPSTIGEGDNDDDAGDD